MFKVVKIFALSLIAFVFVTQAAMAWKVAYNAPLPASETDGWRIVGVYVDVPQALTVSEEDRFAPSADIVWRGEPFGDRRVQVQRILEDGIKAAAGTVSGKRKVQIAVRVRSFHAVTERARAIAPSAVHNISFVIQVFDAKTRQPITQAEVITADLAAYTGSAAIEADRLGQTQRVRIVDHLSKVLTGWLGQGPDMRKQFARLGR